MGQSCGASLSRERAHAVSRNRSCAMTTKINFGNISNFFVFSERVGKIFGEVFFGNRSRPRFFGECRFGDETEKTFLRRMLERNGDDKSR